MPIVEYVRKKDFKLSLVLPPVPSETLADRTKLADGLIDAIYLVKPTFLCPRLVMEVRQPVRGRIANAVVRLCRLGLPSLRLDTLFPDQPTLVDDDRTHHIIYRYETGRIIDQETIMCRDVLDGTEFMTHTLVALFESFFVDTIEWDDKPGFPVLVVDNDQVEVVGDK